MTKNQYYQYLRILQLNEKATVDDIKKAYRTLVKKYHPDIAGRSEYYVEKFREITRAYKLLLKAKENISEEIEEKDIKQVIKDILFKKLKIDNYLLFLRKRKPEENVNFNSVFLKDVDASLLSLGEEELILRLEGSSNFYVMLEAIKALYKLKSKKGLIAAIENYYKYHKELKIFVSFLLKKRIELFSDYFERAIESDNYNIVISVISFLLNIHGDFKEKEFIDTFIRNNLNVPKLEITKFFIKMKKIFSKAELKIGEKLLLTEQVSSDELYIALAVKNRFPDYKIGKIINDLGVLSYREIELILRQKTFFGD